MGLRADITFMVAQMALKDETQLNIIQYQQKVPFRLKQEHSAEVKTVCENQDKVDENRRLDALQIKYQLLQLEKLKLQLMDLIFNIYPSAVKKFHCLLKLNLLNIDGMAVIFRQLDLIEQEDSTALKLLNLKVEIDNLISSIKSNLYNRKKNTRMS